MTIRSLPLAAALALGLVAGASAQSLDGIEVRGHFDIPDLAWLDALNTTATVGDGVEFQFGPVAGGNGGYAFADLDGDTLTIGRYTGTGQWSEETAWRFELPDDSRFTSVTLLSSNFTKPLTFAEVTDGGGLAFGLPKVEPIFDQPQTPGTFYTATYRLTFNSPTAPVPEPATHALLLAGLALAGGAARSARSARSSRTRSGSAADGAGLPSR